MAGRVAAGTVAAILCIACAAQQPATQNGAAQAPRPAEQIAAAQAKLHDAEGAHPGNSKEVAEALNSLIQLERDNGTGDEETLAQAKRLLAMQSALHGARSQEAVDAMETEADLLEGLNQAAEARALMEQADAIAEQEFPRSQLTASVAVELGRICSWMGDFSCAIHAFDTSVDVIRKVEGPDSQTLISALSNRGTMKSRAGDVDGAIHDEEEALAIAHRAYPDDLHYGVIEANLGSAYLKKEKFPQAAEHTQRALEMLGKLYGEDSVRLMQMHARLGDLYTRTGQFAAAWKAYEVVLRLKQGQMDARAMYHAAFSQSLAQGGDLKRAVDEGMTAEQLSREMFVLQARVLPERQALAYNAVRPHGLEVPLSVIAGHPEMAAEGVYEEMVRSRALVADEMARRQRNLNRNNDPDTARLLEELNKARADLLALEQAGKAGSGEAVATATQRMESVERELAVRSAAIREDADLSAAGLRELRRALPAHTALVSYVAYGRRAVGKSDPAMQATASYLAFVVTSTSDRIRIFDLGEAKPIDGLVTRMRSSADAEAHSGGLNSMRNERGYREAGERLRQRVWDPLRPALAGMKKAVVVPDGMLGLVPFAGLPEGKGYLAEGRLTIQTVSSERDLLVSAGEASKHGLLAVGAPQFDLAEAAPAPAVLRDGAIPCDEFAKLDFPSLPGARRELTMVGASWKRWNSNETVATLTGPEATREEFLDGATHSRVLHVATHAFVLDSKCGGGNPLLRSGLVFAGANRSRATAILTAQQIASLDLNGLDLAVLSACNTGTGELSDGEGVLGLERAFRIAGARSVVMTLWPVDDKVTSRYMRSLYDELLARRTTTADAVWATGRRTLLARRAAGQSTHPWYWAGFVASGLQ